MKATKIKAGVVNFYNSGFLLTAETDFFRRRFREKLRRRILLKSYLPPFPY
ncbi:MAG: hypothetical protein M3033_09320 [Acidobacteriota bacterium]|nr:hypothetical protein [Acidobacteriota bacterium]